MAVDLLHRYGQGTATGIVRWVALSADEIASINARARTVGGRIGWELRLEADEDPEFAGLTAGARHVFVLGPTRRTDLAFDHIMSVLEALLLGTRCIVGDDIPRLV